MISRRSGAVLPPLCALLALLPAVSSNPVGASSGAAASTYKPQLGCSVGDVVYLPGDAVPGREACEQCACGAGGALACRRRTCDARPGCKALHRPDECCPTYQCECEQEGRVYANGEKLVDPVDPCKVCYCQGGEVVCRRIACFLRNDCEPRHVPGRCCPEYDHCPLRGVSTEAGNSLGITTSVGGSTGAMKSEIKIAQKTEENIKKEITIKEVTPVSEIPAVFSGIRIKEIPPSPIAEIIEYPPTSKTPLIPKDTSTQTTVADRTIMHAVTRVEETTDANVLKEEPPVKKMETRVSEPPPPGATEGDELSREGSSNYVETSPSVIRPTDTTSRDRPASTAGTASPDTPNKISDGVTTGYRGALAVTKPAPPPEEDDSSTFELVNPAFPPLPDDLSELNRDDSDVTEVHEHLTPVNIQPSTEPIDPASSLSDLNGVEQVTTKLPGKPLTPEIKGVQELPEEWTSMNYSSTDRPLKSSPLLNLRSALPTNILNAPSALPEVITGDLDVSNENSAAGDDGDETTLDPEESTTVSTVDDLATKNVSPSKLPSIPLSEATPSSSSTGFPLDSIRGDHTTVPFTRGSSDTTAQTTSLAEEVHTEFEEFEIKSNTEHNIPLVTSTALPEPTGADISSSVGIVSFVVAEVPLSITNPPEVVQIAHASTTPKNIEFSKSTELPSFPSDERSESVTHSSEEVADVRQHSRSGALIQPAAPNKNNVLTDLINLVGDVASIGERTERPHAAPTATPAAPFPDSEELLPVRGHLTKASSEAIGEVDSNAISESSAERDSTAAPGSQELRTIEISDDDMGAVTDSPPPFDRIEPTTRRPIIDRVSDSQPSRAGGGGDGDATNKKDIEIITKSYVPTINRRPTKVVMKKSSEAASVASAEPAATGRPDSKTPPSSLTPQ